MGQNVGQIYGNKKSPHSFTCKGLEKLVGRAGVEPATLCLKGYLSHRRYSTICYDLEGVTRGKERFAFASNTAFSPLLLIPFLIPIQLALFRGLGYGFTPSCQWLLLAVWSCPLDITEAA